MKKDANAHLRAAVCSIVEEAMGVPPDQDRVNDSIMGDQIKARLGDEFFEMAMGMVHEAEEKVMVHASVIVDQHNMTDSPYGRMSPRSLRTIVDQFDEDTDDKSELMRTCANDIEAALSTFAEQLALYIAHIISPSAR